MKTFEDMDLGQFQSLDLGTLQGLSDTAAQETLVDVLGVPEVSVQDTNNLGLLLMSTTASCADQDGA